MQNTTDIRQKLRTLSQKEILGSNKRQKKLDAIDEALGVGRDQFVVELKEWDKELEDKLREDPKTADKSKPSAVPREDGRYWIDDADIEQGETFDPQWLAEERIRSDLLHQNKDIQFVQELAGAVGWPTVKMFEEADLQRKTLREIASRRAVQQHAMDLKHVQKEKKKIVNEKAVISTKYHDQLNLTESLVPVITEYSNLFRDYENICIKLFNANFLTTVCMKWKEAGVRFVQDQDWNNNVHPISNETDDIDMSSFLTVCSNMTRLSGDNDKLWKMFTELMITYPTNYKFSRLKTRHLFMFFLLYGYTYEAQDLDDTTSRMFNDLLVNEISTEDLTEVCKRTSNIEMVNNLLIETDTFKFSRQDIKQMEDSKAQALKKLMLYHYDHVVEWMFHIKWTKNREEEVLEDKSDLWIHSIDDRIELLSIEYKQDNLEDYARSIYDRDYERAAKMYPLLLSETVWPVDNFDLNGLHGLRKYWLVNMKEELLTNPSILSDKFRTLIRKRLHTSYLDNSKDTFVDFYHWILEAYFICVESEQSEKKEQLDRLSRQQKLLEQREDEILRGKPVTVDYQHRREWVELPQHSGRITLEPIVVRSISSAFNLLLKYAQEFVPADVVERRELHTPFLEFLQYDSLLRVEFATLVASEMEIVMRNNPSKYYQLKSMDQILTQRRSAIQNLRQNFEIVKAGNGWSAKVRTRQSATPLSYNSNRPFVFRSTPFQL